MSKENTSNQSNNDHIVDWKKTELQIFSELSIDEQLTFLNNKKWEFSEVTRKNLFDTINFNANNIEKFFLEYPDQWFIGEIKKTGNPGAWRDGHYSFSYISLLAKEIKNESYREDITNCLHKKLSDNTLIDLWCSVYNEIAWITLESNASMYIGIDLRLSDVWLMPDAIKKFYIQQYWFNNSYTNHKTKFKFIYDNFYNLLKRIPDNAWCNFSINWLALAIHDNGEWIGKDINRIMQPGNIIIANHYENIDIAKVITEPFKHTILNIGISPIHVYEKLSKDMKNLEVQIGNWSYC